MPLLVAGKKTRDEASSCINLGSPSLVLCNLAVPPIPCHVTLRYMPLRAIPGHVQPSRLAQHAIPRQKPGYRKGWSWISGGSREAREGSVL